MEPLGWPSPPSEGGFPMLIKADRSCLIVIDVQERLVPAMQAPARMPPDRAPAAPHGVITRHGTLRRASVLHRPLARSALASGPACSR